MRYFQEYCGSLTGLTLIVFFGMHIGTVQGTEENLCTEKIRCESDKLVVPSHLKDVRHNCTNELGLIEGNMTCHVHCLFGGLNLLSETGKPSMDLFDKFVDTETCSELREDARKCDCFRHAKDTTNITTCQDTIDFDSCVVDFFQNLCKPTVE